MAKILNSWIQRAIIFLRKRFPESPSFWRILRFETGQIIYTCVKRSTTLFVSFCSRKKRFFLQVLYSICILVANDVLTVCDLTHVVACDRELLLERRREILLNRKRMLYHALAWPPKMRMYCIGSYWFHLLPTQSMGDSPGGRGRGETTSWWTSFVPRKTSLVVRTFICIKLTLL